MVNFTLRSTTNQMISISTSQTFRSWVVIFHLRQPMAFLSLNLYDTPGLAPRMNVLFWGPGDFPASYSNMDTSWNAWNRHSGSFMVDTGILFSNMKYPSHECKMTFWSLTNSDFPTNQTFHQFHDLDTELDLHRFDYEWFPWSICNGCGMPAGNAYPSGHLVPSHHCGTCLCSNCWDQIPRTCHVFTRLFTSNTPWYFLDFAYCTSPRQPLFHFSGKKCVPTFCHRDKPLYLLFPSQDLTERTLQWHHINTAKKFWYILHTRRNIHDWKSINLRVFYEWRKLASHS